MTKKTIVSDLGDPLDDSILKLEEELLIGAVNGPILAKKGKIVHKRGQRLLVQETNEKIIVTKGKEGEPF